MSGCPETWQNTDYCSNCLQERQSVPQTILAGAVVSSRDNRVSQNQDKDDDSSDDEKMVICDTAPKSQEKGNIAFEDLRGSTFPAISVCD